MNKKNSMYTIFLLILIGFCFYNCKGQETALDEMCLLKNVHKFLADAKKAGVSDEELASVACSILNQLPNQKLENSLATIEFADLSNKARAIDFTNAVTDSKEASSLSSGERFLIVLVCLVLIGAGTLYICKEYERYRREEALRMAFQGAFQDMARDINKVKHGLSDAWNRVNAWWSGSSQESRRYSQQRQYARSYC
jgi:hypothetical protein